MFIVVWLKILFLVFIYLFCLAPIIRDSRAHVWRPVYVHESPLEKDEDT